MSVYSVKVEESRPAHDGNPSAGPVYRCIYAKDGLLELPDGMLSPWQFFSDSVERNPKNHMLGRRQISESEVDPYIWITYQEAYDTVLKLGSAIRSRGVLPGDKCGIYGSNCPEWILSMEACNSQSVTYVPLYDTLGANAVEFIINHAEIQIAFVQENKLPAILSCLQRCNSHLKTIVSFGEISISSEEKKEAEGLGVSFFSWKEFANLGNADDELPPKQRSDICTIMYTSGTTGEPKGVKLSNEAIMLQVVSTIHLMQVTYKACAEDDVYFSYLPLAHVYDQIVETICFYRGASVAYWRGDVRYLMDDLIALKPTMFCGVPRVYDRIYTGIMGKISAGGALKKAIFQYAYNYKLRNLEKGLPHDNAAPLLDKLVFNNIKQGLGGQLRILLSGAAPLPSHVEEFLRVATCSPLSQGYGLTESCGGCFATIVDVFSMMGTVGVPMPTIEARLESLPELGYDALAKVPRGEICLRGKSLFSGYHKRPDLTDEVLVDGWFHTGDVGEWQPDGSMKIIDRKKNIFKLSQGEYVAVETVENAYMQCPLITSIWVYGNSFESVLVAVAVPERKPLEEWASNNNEEAGDFKSLCNNPRARKYIMDELNKTAKKFKVKNV